MLRIESARWRGTGEEEVDVPTCTREAELVIVLVPFTCCLCTLKSIIGSKPVMIIVEVLYHQQIQFE